MTTPVGGFRGIQCSTCGTITLHRVDETNPKDATCTTCKTVRPR